MNFKLDTPFMEAFEELNNLDETAEEQLEEASDYRASKRFWDDARYWRMNEDAFHAAFDDELKELGLMDVFTSEGAFTGKDVYGKIKAAKEANPDSWAVKALAKLWALRYTSNPNPNTFSYIGQNKFKCEIAADKARQEAEEKRIADEKAAKEAEEEAKLEKYQEVLKTYISEVDPELVKAYEQLTSTSASEDVKLERHINWTRTEGMVESYRIRFVRWGYYYTITENRFLDKTATVEFLTKIFTEAIQDIPKQDIIKKIQKIDVLAADKDATVILLGDSGTLYEIGFGIDERCQRQQLASVNGSTERIPVEDAVTEPYKVIYTSRYWNDGNHSTYRDTCSGVYYSWNSKYENLLRNRIPKKYGRENGYLTSYTETTKITDPSSSRYYSQEDGIDSWANVYTVRAATD